MAYEITLNKAKTVLAANIKAGHNTLLVGPPGVGKTDTYSQIADELGMALMVMHPVVSDPTDFKGFPFRADNNGHAEFLPYGELYAMLKAKKPTLVLFDDVGQAPPAVQAALMQLLLKREINGKRISDKVVFAAATNRREDRAGVSGMLEPVKSRFATILHVTADTDAWVEWALGAGIDERVVAFIRRRPELLLKPAPTSDITNSPSPRTWAAAAKQLSIGLPEDCLYPALAGAVGEGAATELLGFMKCWAELPDIGEILMTPETAKVPETPSGLYAVAVMLAANLTPKNFKQALAYYERLPEEYAVLSVRDLIAHRPEITAAPGWPQFLQTEAGKLATGG